MWKDWQKKYHVWKKSQIRQNSTLAVKYMVNVGEGGRESIVIDWKYTTLNQWPELTLPIMDQMIPLPLDVWGNDNNTSFLWYSCLLEKENNKHSLNQINSQTLMERTFYKTTKLYSSKMSMTKRECFRWNDNWKVRTIEFILWSWIKKKKCNKDSTETIKFAWEL